MFKSLIAAAAVFLSFSLQAGNSQFEELADRAGEQEQHLYNALATKIPAKEVDKVKKDVDNHVDIYRASTSTEFAARLALKRLAFLKKRLPKHFSAAEISDLRLQLALISAFGSEALDNDN